MKKLYGGIDLHANNSVIVLVDAQESAVKSGSDDGPGCLVRGDLSVGGQEAAERS